jgi:hypothetical protein
MSQVKYFERKAIEDFLRQSSFTSLLSGGQNIQFAALLSIKRTEFAHEKEVRLLRHTNNPPGDWLQGRIKPNNVIETVTFDPRLDETKVLRRKSQLKKAGCNASFEESKLYRLDRIVMDF